jgi:ATP-dependent Clp protease ATP-binding subunit ClpA
MQKQILLSITAVSILINFSFSSAAQANDGSNNNSNDQSASLPNDGLKTTVYNPRAVLQSKLIMPKIRAIIKETNDKNLLEVMSITNVLSDKIIIDIINNKRKQVLFRNEEVNKIFDVLIKDAGAKYPVVFGGSGSGKSSVIDQLAYRIVADDLPPGNYAKELKNAVIFEVSARHFLGSDPFHGMDLMDYLQTFDALETFMEIKPIIVIQESHYLSEKEATVLHELIRRGSSFPIIIEANENTLSKLKSEVPALSGSLTPIRVSEPTPEQVRSIINARLAKSLSGKTNIVLDDEVIDTAIKLSADYQKEKSDPQRSMELVEDFVINYSRLHDNSNLNSKVLNPTKKDLYRFVANKAGLPVVSQDEEAFAAYMEKLRTNLKTEVVGQDEVVDGLVDQFSTALQSQQHPHTVAMVMGPTGVGKTYAVERLAQNFYGSSERILEIDMTQFMDENQVNVLFGAANGYKSSDTNKGIICEFLDGRGQGGGIIIMNEIEKAHPKVIKRMMELLDKGKITGGDGKVRYLGKSFIVMTSNKNTNQIMPYDIIEHLTKQELNQRVQRITEDKLKEAFIKKVSYTQNDNEVVPEEIAPRINRWYYARPILKDDALEIAKKEVAKYVRDFESQSNKKLVVDDSFAETIVNASFKQSTGARPLKNEIEHYLSRAIAEHKEKFGYQTQSYFVSAHAHKSKVTESFVVVIDSATNAEVTLPGPKLFVENKLLDKSFRDRLQSLEKNLNSEIFGQEEAIHDVVAAVQARFLKSGKQKPASGFVIGSTGTGKTQLAKSTAKYLFNDTSAVELFEMGRVTDEKELNNIFSSPKGYIGSGDPGQLERFLIKYPDGGVLTFDEASNAGGSNLALKESIMKQFYQLLNEGTYVNPSGKVYDLSNYLILFTGNDGEKIFKGYSNEETLTSIYEDSLKDSQFAEDILRRAGVPDALLGRFSFVRLMRPAKNSVKIQIAKKMIGEWLKSITSSQPIEVELSKDFYSEVGDLMFSPKKGARSIDDFINKVLGEAVTQELLKANFDRLMEKGEKLKFNLSLKTTHPTQPFYKGDKPDTTEAVLVVQVDEKGKKPRTKEVVFTKLANFMPQAYIENARSTAVHEMGHAVSSFTDYTGLKVTRISIVPESLGEGLSALGLTAYEHVPTKHEPDWEMLVKRVAGLLAGSEAEVIFSGDESLRTAGRSNDVERAGSMIRELILKRHLVAELDGTSAYVDKDGNLKDDCPQKLRNIFEDYVEKAFSQATDLAQKTLRENWDVVLAGTKFLMKRNSMSGVEFEKLVKNTVAKRKGKNCSDLLK